MLNQTEYDVCDGCLRSVVEAGLLRRVGRGKFCAECRASLANLVVLIAEKKAIKEDDDG